MARTRPRSAKEMLAEARDRIASLAPEAEALKVELRGAFRGGHAQARVQARELLTQMLAELDSPGKVELPRVTFKKQSPRLIEVHDQTGTFRGHLECFTRLQQNGLHRQSVTTWEGHIAGTNIRSTTLTKAKEQVTKLLTRVSK